MATLDRQDDDQILQEEEVMSPTTLVSIDQGTEEGRYCPRCGTDWRGAQIPVESVDKGYYGHVVPCQKKRVWDDDWDPTTPCTCPPRYYSHLIGVEIRGKYDGVSEWFCPACHTRWDRWTGAELAAKQGEQ